ncbi:DNA polymerase III subunit beta [Mucisphaera calidilacus]|uniref:Beta sliding clamp n=1 Tax=Mucisphaera calidilacus TaxID=2527982 RepID=A0A518BTL1_9BACT|nr:DNA polymerase III subunit beta [Mucisphaera calidilacus]QDU70304.1 DNA polymerase III subunit beta [Mucisphaera calidilacus]
MKVICDRAALVEALNTVSGVVLARTPKPVLRCIKLTADDSPPTLTLVGTDTEVTVTLRTERIEVAEAGEALIPADKLGQIVRESLDPTIEITTDDESAVITGKDSRFKVFGYPVADFGSVPEFDGDAEFEIAAGDLHRLISMTIFATARENSRYAINGVLLERDGNKLAVVATDGHRLALAKGSCKAGGDEPRSAIVPTKALNLLLKLFDDPEQVVRCRVADNQIFFATDQATLVSNLVEGNFPPYQDVIPKDGDKKAQVATDMLVSAVRRAALLTNEESKGVRMAFDEGGLTLTSRAPEMGEAEIKTELSGYSGEAIEIGFNPTYVLDALKVVDSEEVTLELKAGNKPGVLKTDNQFLYVVMPVSLS